LKTITRVGINASENMLPLFRFRLNKGQSIGPGELRDIWRNACGTQEVTVARTNSGGVFLYSLGAPQRLMRAEGVEGRLRALLAVSLPHATIDLFRI
jgi:hypothetical protein